MPPTLFLINIRPVNVINTKIKMNIFQHLSQFIYFVYWYISNDL